MWVFFALVWPCQLFVRLWYRVSDVLDLSLMSKRFGFWSYITHVIVLTFKEIHCIAFVELSDCRTNGPSDYRTVGLSDRRTIGLSDNRSDPTWTVGNCSKEATQANISTPQQCGGHSSLYFNWNITNRCISELLDYSITFAIKPRIPPTKALARRHLIVKPDSSASWFVGIKHLHKKYELKEAQSYLDKPESKTMWTLSVKQAVYKKLVNKITSLIPLYKGLTFLTSENLEKGKIHPLLKVNCHTGKDTSRLSVKLKLLTGSYILQSKRILMYKTETEPTCLLCKDKEETM